MCKGFRLFRASFTPLFRFRQFIPLSNAYSADPGRHTGDKSQAVVSVVNAKQVISQVMRRVFPVYPESRHHFDALKPPFQAAQLH